MTCTTITEPILKDDVKHIKTIVENRQAEFLYATLSYPEPDSLITLKYKKGDKSSDYHNWFYNLFHSSSIIVDDVYERVIYGEKSLYLSRDLKYFINRQGYSHYVWKEENKKHPVYFNYAIELHWKNKYGNTHSSTKIYFISEDEEFCKSVVDDVNAKYATYYAFKCDK